ncbi:hypothetical protein DSTSK_16950 [Desulforhabdus sp. TSK]|nr:hypothetical protein DSTSK_16950 [Desulforhabdus sp. TSK]
MAFHFYGRNARQILFPQEIDAQLQTTAGLAVLSLFQCL